MEREKREMKATGRAIERFAARLQAELATPDGRARLTAFLDDIQHDAWRRQCDASTTDDGGPNTRDAVAI